MAEIVYEKEYEQSKYENGIWKGPKIVYSEGRHKYGEILLACMEKNSTLIGQVDAITGKQDTFGDMADRSIRCALWLKKQNINPGDIIGICTGNHLNSIIPVISSLLIGSILNPWWNFSEEELIRYFVDYTQPKIIFVAEANVKLIQKVFDENKIESKVVVFGKIDGLESFDDILAAQDEKEVANFKCTEITSPDHPAIIMYTSGTTGMPKGVVLSYKSISRCQVFIPKELTGQPIGMNFSSVAWVTGIGNPLSAIEAGSKLVIFYGLSDTDTFKLISKYKVNWMSASTGVVNRMSKNPVFENLDCSSVKYFRFGGVRVKKDVLEFLEKTFPNAWVINCYGATETRGFTLRTEKVHHQKSCGKVVANIEIKIMSIDDQEKKILGPNEEGELYIKTPTMMLYYYNNPEETAAVLDADGWFRTGDLGYYNEDGEFFLTDRVREMIKSGYSHVPPGSIEDVILNHPGVCEVAVVGKPNNNYMQLPLAFIVTNPNAEVTEEEIVKLVDKSLPDRFKLRGGVKFVECLPRTPSDKVAKRVLRELAAQMAEEEAKLNDNTTS